MGEDDEETKKIRALSSNRDEDWDESEFTGEARISAGSKAYKSKHVIIDLDWPKPLHTLEVLMKI